MKLSSLYSTLGGLCILLCLAACSFANNGEPRFPFQTDEADSLSHYELVVIGDNKPKVGTLDIFLNLINKTEAPHFVHLGDLIPYSSPLGFHAIIESLESLSSATQPHFTIGNHDVADSTGKITSQNIQLYHEFMKHDDNDPGYFVVEETDYVLLILNTTYPNYNDLDEPQYEWLETQLQTYTDKTILVFTHHPIFPAGHHDPLYSASRFHELMTTYTVTAVFSGHEHLYYKTIEDGVTYVVSGGGGSGFHATDKGEELYHMLGITLNPLHIDVIDIGGNIVEF